MCEVLIVVSDLKSIWSPSLKPEKYMLVLPTTRYFQTFNQRTQLYRFCNFLWARPNNNATTFKKCSQKSGVVVSFKSSAVYSITSCCFFLSAWLSPFSVCLVLSHSPLSLLWGVKKEPIGDLRSIMQVCSCAFSCRLFAPHIAFLPIETHTHIHTISDTWTELHICRGNWTLAASVHLVPGVRLRGA